MMMMVFSCIFPGESTLNLCWYTWFISWYNNMTPTSLMLVGALFFLFLHILGIVTPTDFHIFPRGWNHQPDNQPVINGNQHGNLSGSTSCVDTQPSGWSWKFFWHVVFRETDWTLTGSIFVISSSRVVDIDNLQSCFFLDIALEIKPEKVCIYIYSIIYI